MNRSQLRPSLSRDDGSATLTTAGCIIAMTIIFAAMVSLVRATTDSHRAQVAADLAAIAAAYAHYRGEQACSTADRVARDNNATLISCDLTTSASDPSGANSPTADSTGVPQDVDVRVHYGAATATARAGPL